MYIEENNRAVFVRNGHLYRYSQLRQRCAEQIIGREGETATLLSRCPSNLNGLGGGFAPRHLSRYALTPFVSNVFNFPQDYFLCVPVKAVAAPKPI